jgi:DNA mismatch endonuclease (patch repair protein)|tara:strand:+ start:619 stop:1047 length:429 start_codon:yes stop_codon:yes gene_type:complete
MDKISKELRSLNMSRIKSVNTKPEQIVKKYLYSKGVRYRCNNPKLPGKPDISNIKYRLALDVHGCFWHGHQNCRNFRLPKTNKVFWKNKIFKNIERDERNRKLLTERDFVYMVIWECEIKSNNFDVLDQFTLFYKERTKIAK